MKNSNINDDTISFLWTINETFALTSINLSQNFSFITDKSIEHMCRCVGVQNLVHLNLADDSITDQGIKIMAGSQVMQNLEELVLYGNSDITSQALIMVAESPWVKKLRRLDLHATSIDDQGIFLSIQVSAIS